MATASPTAARPNSPSPRPLAECKRVRREARREPQLEESLACSVARDERVEPVGVDLHLSRAAAVDRHADGAVPPENEVHAPRLEVQPQSSVSAGDDPFTRDRPGPGI